MTSQSDALVFDAGPLRHFAIQGWLGVLKFLAGDRPVVVRGENRGECGVLALGEVRGFEVVLDDAVPRVIAEEKGIRVTATLPLLCKAIRDDKLTVPMVEQLADDLISGEYFLPCESGGFRRWALEEGLLDYS